MLRTWTRLGKRERNERVIKFAETHPDWTHRAIAGIFRIDRSRVSRILQRARDGTNS